MEKYINTIDLLALIDVFDEYEEFDKDLTKLLSSKKAQLIY